MRTRYVLCRALVHWCCLISGCDALQVELLAQITREAAKTIQKSTVSSSDPGVTSGQQRWRRGTATNGARRAAPVASPRLSVDSFRLLPGVASSVFCEALKIHLVSQCRLSAHHRCFVQVYSVSASTQPFWCQCTDLMVDCLGWPTRRPYRIVTYAALNDHALRSVH